MSEKPVLSVIVASYNSKTTIGSCLTSLESQTVDKEFEVIVVDSSVDGTAGIVAQKFPRVRLHAFPDRKYCGDARNFGISVAKADLIAFLDADCTADVRWVEEIVRAHEKDALAVGGSVASAEPGSMVGWASYFTEFSPWMPKARPCWLKDIAGANMSYKKAAFALFGGFIEETYCSDTEFHWRMTKKGRLLYFQPSIRVSHRNIASPGKFLSHEFMHGRSFGRVRVRYGNFSKMPRLFYALLFFPIACKLFLQVIGRNLKNKIYLKYFLFSLPLVAAGLLAWSLGEAAGYLERQK